ncbi:HlyC/CorC family transporter [Floccifex sp.]|uniref:HlyC/CorC family transporter n=1 Tax=Floccifex sp. TaxID=2815810 RepID=UPI003F038CEB
MDTELELQIIVLIILLFLSSFFSSAETSLVSVNKIKIRSEAEKGNKRAHTLLKVYEKEDKMLSAILIGNNLVNTYAASIATSIAYVFGGAAVGVATFIITLFILIFGEITPKTLATKNAEKMALMYAPIILFLMRILTPFIFVINAVSNVVLKLLGINDKDNNPSMTETELRTMMDVSHEEGVIEEEEKNMINNVFDFGDAKARDVMVPRVHVVMADINSTYKDLLEIFKEERFTRIPIYKDSMDNIIGLVNMKDLLLYDNLDQFDINKVLRKPYFTYETKKISELLVEMKESTFNLAIVVDEYGELAGIITLEDIIEEIVGDVHDEYDEEEQENIKKINDTIYDVKGYINLHDLNDALDLDLDSEDFDSIGGLVIDALGRFPQQYDTVTLENGIKIKVVSLDKNRIEEVRLYLPTPQEEEQN